MRTVYIIIAIVGFLLAIAVFINFIVRSPAGTGFLTDIFGWDTIRATSIGIIGILVGGFCCWLASHRHKKS